MKKIKQVEVEESRAPHLCDELITNILLRVPTKTKSRCKKVCKGWKNLIIDTYFSQALKSLPPITAGFFYVEKRRDPNTVKQLDHYGVKYYCCITNKVYHNTIPPNDNLIFPFRIVASHNGFVLCVESTGTIPRVFVCNPYTKQWLVLPQNANLRKVCGNELILFCYEKQGFDTVDFKVLRFNFRSVWSFKPPDILQVHMYSSETGEWTVSEMLQISPTRADYLRKSEKILVGSDLVYLWNRQFSEVGVYDLNRESIRFMTLPLRAEKFNQNNYLGVFAESVYYAEISDSSVSLWVHEREDEWSLKHSVSFRTLDFNTRLLGFHPMKLGLIIESTWFKVRLYDVDRRKMEDFPYFRPDNTRVVPYMLPEWLPTLKNSRNMNQGVWRSPLSLHED